MKNKLPVNYVYLHCGNSHIGRIQTAKQRIAEIQVLDMELSLKKGDFLEKEKKSKCQNRWKRRIYKKLKMYDWTSCAINGEEIIQTFLLEENVGFKARKKELLTRGNIIFQWMKKKCPENSRKKLLLYVESEKWEESELYQIIWMAKNDYEDIVVACDNPAQLEDMAGKLLKESGLMISLIDMKCAKKEPFECAVLLLREWKESSRSRFCFKCAYVVVEQEHNMQNMRKNKGEINRRTGECCSGFCYACGNQVVPYQMAVDLLYQKPAFCEKIGISVVAIYCLECYNIENEAQNNGV